VNEVEWVAYVATLISFLALTRWFLGTWRIALFVTVVCALPIYLSLAGTTQFATTDEIGIYGDVRARNSRGMSQWGLGAFRTTIATTLPLVGFLERMNIDRDVLFMILKAYHWLLGFAVIAATGVALYYLLQPMRLRLFYWVAFWWLTLLLPIDNVAAKVFNYDSISMFGGLLALLLSALALRSKRLSCALAAVVLSALAAQEKVIASPILLMSIAVLALVVSGAPGNRRYLAGLYGVFLGLGVASGVMYATGLVYAASVALRPIQFWPGLLDPLITWTWLPMRFLLRILDFGDWRWVSALIVLGSAVAIAFVAIFLARLAESHASVAAALPKLLDRTASVLLVLVFIVGVAGLVMLQAYWAPQFPSMRVDLGTNNEMNGIQLHFDAGSLLEHRVDFIIYAYSVFVGALPTAIWVMLGAALFLRLFQRSERWLPELDVVLLIALAGPLGIALILVPLGHRYMNVLLMIAAVCILAKFIDAAQGLSAKRPSAWGIAAFGVVLAALMLYEVVPFGPFYAAFRPLWLEYADPISPVKGKINPSWLGWGEETMLAGTRLESDCRQSAGGQLHGVPCNEITLYSIYPGAWIEPDKQIKSVSCCRPGEQPMTNADYYVINRSAAVQGYPFPYEVEPEFVIAFRGFVQAWVFRGDRLAAAGFALQ
jgi:hypothetical protein